MTDEPRQHRTAAARAALNVSNAWADPPEATRELGSVFQSALVGLITLDARQIPSALALLAQVNQCVAAIAPPADTKH